VFGIATMLLAIYTMLVPKGMANPKLATICRCSLSVGGCFDQIPTAS
jgi:hypothetical protein